MTSAARRSVIQTVTILELFFFCFENGVCIKTQLRIRLQQVTALSNIQGEEEPYMTPPVPLV
jgi:hypothetical protein